MGIILRQAVSPSAEIGLWDITSSSMEDLMKNMVLDEKNKSEILALKNESRKKEVLTTKMLMQELLGKETELFYDQNGKPFLKNSGIHISLSHSGKYVAAIIDKKHPTGIDIQKMTAKITRIKEKFLSKTELENISGKQNDIEALHVLWGAKECIFKEHGAGNIIFSEQIIIEPFDFNSEGEIKGRLELKNHKIFFTLGYRELSGYMLVYIRELANIVT